MRTDLSAAFIAAKNSDSSSPRQLARFYFESAGNVYLSDQDITVNGIFYSGLIADWGSIEDAADSEDNNNSEILQQTITINNNGSIPFSNYFLTEDPENVIVEIYQWFTTIPEADQVLIDRFAIQDPIEFDEASSLLKLDLVSLSARYNSLVGGVLTKDAYPQANENDVGKGIDYIVGSPGQIKTLNSKTTSETTLDGPIIASSTTINVFDDVSSWTQPGHVQIDEEFIAFSTASGNTITVTGRGAKGSAPAEHMDNAKVILYLDDHSYILGRGPLSLIRNVKVDGVLAPTSIYTTYPSSNPARISFNQKPYSYQFSASSDLEKVNLDDIATGNTAFQAHYAYDDARGTSALISELYPSLRIKQTDINKDIGQITRAILTVEHWSTALYANDRASVWVEGIGTVGYLSRPNSSDNIYLEGDVDIDHPHDHNVGGRHDHPYVDPGIGTQNPLHNHGLAATEGRVGNSEDGTYAPPGISGGPAGVTREFTIWFNNLASESTSSVITLPVFSVYSGYAELQFIELIPEWGDTVVFNTLQPDFNGTLTINGGNWPAQYSNQNYRLDVRIALYVNSGSIAVSIQNPLINYNAKVNNTYFKSPGVSSYVSASGAVNNQQVDTTGLLIKDSNDVKELLTDNRQLDFYTTELPTRTIIDRFDISDYITPTWSWFNDREIRITYEGTVDNVNVLITDVKFDVYTRKRIKVYSDNVTAEIVPIEDNKPSSVIKNLLINVAKLPLSYIDTNSFSSAATFYLNNGYALHGVISADSTVREAIKNILLQSRSRLIWGAGKCKLVVKEDIGDWTIDKDILAENIQLKSISARRQKISDIFNVINAPYKKDWTMDGIESYTEVAHGESLESIEKNGEIEGRDKWLFDLVRSDAMAQDLVDYYIGYHSRASTFYNFNCYLEQFELEKEDKIRLTSSGFNSLIKVPLVIRSANRIFGSSETGQINLINLIAESFRYLIINIPISESLIIFENISVEKGFTADLAEILQLADNQAFEIERKESITINIIESFAILAEYATSFGETITISYDIVFDIEMDIIDTAILLENVAIDRDFGFGSGGFGTEVRFGGLKAWGETNPDEILVVENLGFDIDQAVTDTQLLTENMAMSDGFGSPSIGDGFGQVPFGG